MALDPFTQAYQAIWSALSSDAKWTALAAVRNRIDTSAVGFRIFKDTKTTVDLPEFALLQGHFSIKPFGVNSRVVSIAQSYDCWVTQEFLNSVPANALKYATLVALFNVGAQLGLSFVRGWEIAHAIDDSLNKHPSWTGGDRLLSIFSIIVSMDIPRDRLADFQ